MQSAYLFNAVIVVYLMFSQKMDDVKRSLEKLLTEWKPKDFQGHQRGAHRIDPFRVRLLVDVLAMNSCEVSA